MKLLEIDRDNSRVGNEYLLISGVTDDDAYILSYCGMTNIDDYDVMDDDGNNYEAWIRNEYLPYVE